MEENLHLLHPVKDKVKSLKSQATDQKKIFIKQYLKKTYNQNIQKILTQQHKANNLINEQTTQNLKNKQPN